MTEGDLYRTVDEYSKADRLAYVHFRNVRGKVPNYTETFVDEGDTDMLRIVRILAKNRFDGVLIPDHTPQMSCEAPWHGVRDGLHEGGATNGRGRYTVVIGGDTAAWIQESEG
jgi:D-mannonate dehydratase